VKYVFGILTSAIILIAVTVLWIYSKKRQSKRERFVLK